MMDSPCHFNKDNGEARSHSINNEFSDLHSNEGITFESFDAYKDYRNDQEFVSSYQTLSGF